MRCIYQLFIVKNTVTDSFAYLKGSVKLIDSLFMELYYQNSLCLALLDKEGTIYERQKPSVIRT